MRIKILCAWLVWVSFLGPPPAHAFEEQFIVPGVDFSQLDLTTGAWCRYLVVDKALGIDDSTELYIAIPSSVETQDGEAYWVEIQSKPYGADVADEVIYKLLILDAITQASEKDTLVHYVVELYIKKGHGPVSVEDPTRLREFPLGPPSSSSLWIIEPGVTVTTPAGDFSCEKKKRSVVTEKEIPTGRIKLVEMRNDPWVVCFA
ncbi:MAG: hypothetical protein ABIA59_09740, partial [Candidatus Latescibacterota bacterium]